jgi:oligopeptidase A
MQTRKNTKTTQVIDFINDFKKNLIWKKLIYINIEKQSEQLENDLPLFLEYLMEEVNVITKDIISWNNTYVKLKKIINVLYYLQAYITTFNEIQNKTVEDSFCQITFKWQDKIQKTLDAIRCNELLITKFKLLKKIDLNKSQATIINNWLQEYFEIQLKPEVKNEHIKLMNQLEIYSRKFQQNHQQALWKEEYALCIPVNKSEWLNGLSVENIAVGNFNAKQKNKKGWIFYVDDATSALLLCEASNRGFRKKIYENYQNLNSDKRFLMNNDAVLRNILSTKQKVAKLYKKENYSELVLSEYILNKTTQVYDYLDSLEYELHLLVDNVKKNLTGWAAEDGIKILKPWDIPYYYNKIKKYHNFKKVDVFAQYFSFETLWPKLLKFLSSQFDLIFKKIDHPLTTRENQLLCYEIKDKRSLKCSYWLISPFDNSIKPSAYERDLLTAEYIEGGKLLPAIQYISLQLNKGKNRTPLSLTQLLILLHEIGHAFHSFFAPMEDSLSNSVQMGWDLIELPSQFLEHLVYDKNFLIHFSEHYKTKQKIDEDTIKDIIEKEQYFEGYEMYQQILKYRANFWLHENFKPYSQKNPHQIVEEKLAKEGVIYNIARDEGMICRSHNMDYGSTGYIYLYSAQLAFQLFEFYVENNGFQKKHALRNIYEEVFNSSKYGKVKTYLDKYVDFEKTNMLKFLQKTWNIDLYGINNWKDKQDNLAKLIFKDIK